jgi:hypothetical protein
LLDLVERYKRAGQLPILCQGAMNCLHHFIEGNVLDVRVLSFQQLMDIRGLISEARFQLQEVVGQRGRFREIPQLIAPVLPAVFPHPRAQLLVDSFLLEPEHKLRQRVLLRQSDGLEDQPEEGKANASLGPGA